MSAGVRDERTDVSSSGVGRLPIAADGQRGRSDAADHDVLGRAADHDQSSYYTILLPSLDMKLELTPELHLRFDASRTLTRPAINFLTPVLNVGQLPRIGALTATGGNPESEAVSVGQLRSRGRVVLPAELVPRRSTRS